MVKTFAVLLFLMLLQLATITQAVTNEALFNSFVQQGVPAPALTRVFEFLETNQGQAVPVQKKFSSSRSDYVMRKVSLNLQNDFAAIIDFTMPSTQKRLFLLNLKEGTVERFYTTHGRNTGQNTPLRFSNRSGSKQSSLGLYLAGEAYIGRYGKSMKLHGLDSSNSRAAERDIVMHPADYASEEFLRTNGRLGLSWGCTAVQKVDAAKILTSLKEGSMIYIYHADLMNQARLTPESQVWLKAKSIQEPVQDLPGEEEDLSRRRQ